MTPHPYLGRLVGHPDLAVPILYLDLTDARPRLLP
jgi:hypothetical protein